MKREVTIDFQTGEVVRVIDDQCAEFNQIGIVVHARVYAGIGDPVRIDYSVIFDSKPGKFGNHQNYFAAFRLEAVNAKTSE